MRALTWARLQRTHTPAPFTRLFLDADRAARPQQRVKARCDLGVLLLPRCPQRFRVLKRWPQERQEVLHLSITVLRRHGSVQGSFARAGHPTIIGSGPAQPPRSQRACAAHLSGTTRAEVRRLLAAHPDAQLERGVCLADAGDAVSGAVRVHQFRGQESLAELPNACHVPDHCGRAQGQRGTRSARHTVRVTHALCVCSSGQEAAVAYARRPHGLVTPSSSRTSLTWLVRERLRAVDVAPAWVALGIASDTHACMHMPRAHPCAWCQAGREGTHAHACHTHACAFVHGLTKQTGANRC